MHTSQLTFESCIAEYQKSLSVFQMLEKNTYFLIEIDNRTESKQSKYENIDVIITKFI